MEVELKPWGIIPTDLLQSATASNHPPSVAKREDNKIPEDASDTPSQCLTAISTGKQFLVVINGLRAQFLSTEGGLKDKQLGMVYKPVWDGFLPIANETELGVSIQATAVIVLLISAGRDGDLTRCIAVGFSDGYLRFYRENGILFFSHQLHKEAVRKISISIPVKFGSRRLKQDELVVLYETVLCVVSGPSICHCVRESWERDLLREGADSPELPSLSYKKWYLDGHKETMDVTSLVACNVTMFDQLAELSKVKGFEGNQRSVVPYDRKIVAVGNQPMLALYNVSKDAGVVHMSEVVSAVASKVKTAVISKFSNWWWGKSEETSQAPQRQPQQVEHTSSISMSCNIPDQSRVVHRIWPSPCGRLLATTDNYGRVLLLTSSDFTVVRMWKGYRDTQCGWIEVMEKEEDIVRESLCLCIYVGRRGILEIWPVQSGPRVAAFQVGKECQLLHANPVIFGNHKRLPKSQVLLLTKEGQLVSFVIPLHMLLKSGSTHARDLLLLRKLPKAMAIGDSDLIGTAFGTIQSTRLILQGIDVLLRESARSSLPLSFVVQMIHKVVGRIKSANECGSQLSSPTNLLKEHLTRLLQVIQLFVSLQAAHKLQGEKYPFREFMREVLVSKYLIPPSIAGSLTSVLNGYFKGFSPPKADSSMKLQLKEFVSCFDLVFKGPDFQLPKETEGDPSAGEGQVMASQKQSLVVKFHPKLDGDLLIRFGAALFESTLCYIQKSFKLSECLIQCGIEGPDLLPILCEAWLSKGVSPGNSPAGCLEGLGSSLDVVHTVSRSHQRHVVWTCVCECSRASVNFGHALLLNVVTYKFTKDAAQPVSMEMNKQQEAEDTVPIADSNDGNWESVSEEDSQWYHVLQELEFFTRLSQLLPRSAPLTFPLLPRVRFMADRRMDMERLQSIGRRSEGDLLPLTVNLFRESGPRVATHAVAHWLVGTGANPVVLELTEAYKEDLLQLLIEEERHLVPKLRQLYESSPVPLNKDDIHVSCVWQSCSSFIEESTQRLSRYRTAQRHLLNISNPVLTAATGQMMWNLVYRPVMIEVITEAKKVINLKEEVLELISQGRQLLGVLVQLCQQQLVEKDGVTMVTEEDEDMQERSSESREGNLTAALLTCTPLNEEVLTLHYAVMMVLELVAVLHLTPIRVSSLFDIWAQGSLGGGLSEEPVKKKGRSNAALKKQQMKFLTKVLVTIIRDVPRKQPLPYIHKMASSSPKDVMLTSWLDLVYHLCEFLSEGMEEESKELYIWLLFVAGHDAEAIEVLRGVSGGKVLTEKLLQLASQRVFRCLEEEEDESKKTAILVEVPPQVIEWITKQGTIKIIEDFPLQTSSWKDARILINSISNSCSLTPQQQTIIQNLKLIINSFYTDL